MCASSCVSKCTTDMCVSVKVFVSIAVLLSLCVCWTARVPISEWISVCVYIYL